MPNKISIHKHFLFEAHKQSLKFLGHTYPNPSVGCVIVDFKKNKKGIIISRGSTGKLGRPHAEEEALKNIKRISNDMIMYLTFEPCNHKSKYTSCVDMIIKSGIKNIFIAAEDPDLRTKFKSLNKLIKNHINVNFGLTKNITYLNNRFFYINKKLNRSYIKYKLAVSKDLKIAKFNYESKWISNKLSRKYSHSIRYVSDAILTTYNTVKYDNPKLTIRFGEKDLYKNSIIILDSKLDININSNLIKSSKKRRIIIFTMANNLKKIKILKLLKCEVYLFKKSKYFDIKKLVKKTYDLGIYNILIEAGGKLFTNMYNNGIIDEFHLFKSPKKIGNKGIPMYLSKKNFSFNKLNKHLIHKKIFIKDSYFQYLL